ncbi:hypothetical protein T492DRAFT_976404 [Pavlovales sp. CCMP2436]|nr:hypothetical protein T492DRAFT_976404 [Pavlovales sp. CCMP2436]
MPRPAWQDQATLSPVLPSGMAAPAREHSSAAAGWVYSAAQPGVAARRGKQTTAPLTATGPGFLSASRRSSSLSALQRPQTSGAGEMLERPHNRPRSGGLGLKLARTAGPLDFSRPASTDERKRRMAHVSLLAIQAERAAAAAKEAGDEVASLRADLDRGESALTMRHESAVALERAVHTAIRQLDAAESAAARTSARTLTLSSGGAQTQAEPGRLSSAERCAELEERAAAMLLEIAVRMVANPAPGAGQLRGHVGEEAEAKELGRPIVTLDHSEEQSDAPADSLSPEAELAEAARAVVVALAGVRGVGHGGGGRAGEEEGGSALQRPKAVYAASLAHAPWISVDPLTWAVLLPSSLVSGAGEGNDNEEGSEKDSPRARQASHREGGERQGSGGDEGQDEDEEEGSEGSLVAVPLEVLCSQHASLTARLIGMRTAATALEVEVRTLAQAAQFAQMDTDRDGYVTLADARARAVEWGLPLPVLERAFSGAVLPLSGGRGKMTVLDFADFVSWVEDGGQSDEGLRAWFRCLDLDGDGCISTTDLRSWHDLVQARAAAPSSGVSDPAVPAALLIPEPSADGSGVRPFSQASPSQRPEAHLDAGEADTPRAAAGEGAVESRLLKSGTEPVVQLIKNTSEVVEGNGTFTDLLCQLTDMLSAGARKTTASGEPRASGGERATAPTTALAFTFGALQRCKLAPAMLQLLLMPPPRG